MILDFQNIISSSNMRLATRPGFTRKVPDFQRCPGVLDGVLRVLKTTKLTHFQLLTQKSSKELKSKRYKSIPDHYNCSVSLRKVIAKSEVVVLNITASEDQEELTKVRMNILIKISLSI